MGSQRVRRDLATEQQHSISPFNTYVTSGKVKISLHLPSTSVRVSDATSLKTFTLSATAFERCGDTWFNGYFLCLTEHISSISQLNRPVIPLKPQDAIKEEWFYLDLQGTKRMWSFAPKESNAAERKSMEMGLRGSPRPGAKSPGGSWAQQRMLSYF